MQKLRYATSRVAVTSFAFMFPLVARATLAVISLLVSLALLLPLSLAGTMAWVAAAQADSRPVVYLTFDDGPSADSVTDEVLRVLAAYNATATFFVTGERVRRNHEKIADIVYAGHAIGNHTYRHSKLTMVSDVEVSRELKDATDAILAAGGPVPSCFRPPFGATDQRVNSIAKGFGMEPVVWSVDTRDWERTVDVDAISDALDRTRNQSVVLMHDGPAHRGKTLQAFTEWMKTASQKFQFQSLPECRSGSGLTYAEAGPFDYEPQPDLLSSTSIPLLLAKIRGYQFELHQRGEQVDLSQITATLSSELQPAKTYYSF